MTLESLRKMGDEALQKLVDGNEDFVATCCMGGGMQGKEKIEENEELKYIKFKIKRKNSKTKKEYKKQNLKGN